MSALSGLPSASEPAEMQPAPKTLMSPSRRQTRERGFTIIELAIVTMIIGILAALALPLFRHLLARVQAQTAVNDLRVFREAFRLYSAEHGAWPSPQGGATVPPGMAGYLAETAWTRRAPIGGTYRWDRDGTAGGKAFRAAIRVVSSGDRPIVADYNTLLMIDRQFDDGNLLSGALQSDAYPQLIFIFD